MCTKRNRRNRKEYLIFGVIISIIILISCTSIFSIISMQGNARVVNFAGIVRGGTQKLIKEEIMGWHYMQDGDVTEAPDWYPNDALLNKLDVIVNELLTGEGPNGLVLLKDESFISDMQAVKEHWVQMKELIYDVRSGANPNELFYSSQEYFALVNNAVFSAEAYSDSQVTRTTFILIAVNALFLSFVVAILLYYMRRIAEPLSSLTCLMNNINATGDLELETEDVEGIRKLAERKGEVGQAISSSVAFVSHVSEASRLLGRIAEGDLTAEPVTLSDKDTVGMSIQKMTGKLNIMFEEIQTTTTQVFDEALSIADESHALAVGSTTQAETIDELTKSISEIAMQTKANAETAVCAARLSGSIKEMAEAGSQHMNEMTKAVEEINDANHNIGRIIKTIDEIAFQTNILALNAAVEAARAGIHGKGFAVVAEEVRHLASKSAEAASDTGNMIKNSIEKAELGSRIAAETAESLSGIVSGINENSKFITDIAQASDEQSAGIEKIKTFIDLVAQFIQKNSETTKESEAASGDMSRQTGMLKDMISQFKLKNRSNVAKTPERYRLGTGFQNRLNAPSGIKNDVA
jgi:methyl-accepting chemotaxis protein